MFRQIWQTGKQETLNNSAGDFLILTGDLTADDLGARIGGLDLGQATAGSTASFAVLDTFDQAVRSGGQMLIETDRSLILYDGDATLLQDARRRGAFVADLAPGPVKDALQHLSPLRALLSLGTGTVSHRQLVLTDDEGKTQARADLATLHPAGEGAAVTLATLRGLRGYDSALEALRSHLVAFAAPDGAGIADLPDLMFPGNSPYASKPKVAITPDCTAFEAANAIIAANLAVARRNEAGIIADHDTEFLHDYRVALRRIRSVVSLFKEVYSEPQTTALKVAFSDMMAPTGRLRDLDVYLLERDHYYAMLPEGLHDGLSVMFAMMQKERQREHRKMARRLNSASYLAAIAELEAMFGPDGDLERGPRADQQALGYACKLIWKRYRKVCAVAATISDDTADEHVHELRIICKKLRYLLEFFAPLLPEKSLGPILKPLKKLQDNLGLFNDYSVQQQALGDFMPGPASKTGAQDLVLAQSIGALIAVLHARQKDERAKVMSNLSHFDSPDMQEKFRDLFHSKGG